MKIPSFDEWFETKYGPSFDDSYMQSHMGRGDGMRALIRFVRDYVSEIAGMVNGETDARS